MIELTKQYQKIATGASQTFGYATGYLELWAKYNSNDSNTNRTNYSVQLRLVVQNGYIGNYQSTPWSIGGNITANGDIGAGSHTSRVLGTATGTVTHELDGTKNVSMTGSFNATAWEQVLTVSGSAKLPNLHKPPVINSISVSEQNEILTNAGISNETFVRWLSKKSFAFDTTTFDDATITSYEVINAKTTIASGEETPISADFKNIALYANENTTTLDFKVKDSKNGIANISQVYDFVPYFKPNFVNTDTKALRQGQTSGRVILNANGSFYNSDIGNLSASCKVYFKYWVKGEEEPETYTEIPNENIFINENTFIINEYLLGTDFDYKKSYYVKVFVQDGFYSSEPLVLPIPVGEATWTEYKDRVDFIKATVRGKEVATKEEMLSKNGKIAHYNNQAVNMPSIDIPLDIPINVGNHYRYEIIVSCATQTGLHMIYGNKIADDIYSQIHGGTSVGNTDIGTYRRINQAKRIGVSGPVNSMITGTINVDTDVIRNTFNCINGEETWGRISHGLQYCMTGGFAKDEIDYITIKAENGSNIVNLIVNVWLNN